MIEETKMNTSKQTAKTVINLHGANALNGMFKKRPSDSRYMAISKNKCASIFYKNVQGVLYADYRNGKGWEKAQQISVGDLEKDLHGVSFMLCELDDLEAELSNHPLDELQCNGGPLVELKGRIDAQFARVSLRRDAEGDPNGYWAGSHEAYEIVLNMIRDIDSPQKRA